MALKVKVLLLDGAATLPVNSTLLQVKPSTSMSAAKVATTVEVPALQTEMAVVRQTSALAEMPSKTVSSLPVVAVVLVRRAQVVTVVLGKLVLVALLVLVVIAQDVAPMPAQVAMALALVVETVVTLVVDLQAVAAVLV
jgi:hypothetical protein